MRIAFAALFLFAVAAAPVFAAPSPAAEKIPAAGTYVVNSDRVNVRAAPDTDSGQVVGRLNKGDKVQVVEMTALAFDVQGMRAAWFHLSTPDGWVFGYYLDPGE